jgi:hypothetical protein
VRATDQAGNVDPTPAVYGWTVDCPVRLNGSCFSTLQEAYTYAPDGSLIEAQAYEFVEDLKLVGNISGKNSSVTLKGGFSFDYQTVISATTLRGTLIVIEGTLTVDGLALQ